MHRPPVQGGAAKSWDQVSIVRQGLSKQAFDLSADVLVRTYRSLGVLRSSALLPTGKERTALGEEWIGFDVKLASHFRKKINQIDT